MRNVLVCLLALTFLMGTATFAQDNMGQGAKTDNAAAAPQKNIKGTVKAEGDKLTFVADKGGKSWDVMNPETLKGHEGHHLQLSAHVYADKGAIHVMSVKMLKGDSMGKGEMK